MAKPTLALQIRDGIRARIRAGDWTDRLPSEPDLGELFGASRETVRKALAALEQEGLIYRAHGQGTFVEASLAFNPLSGALSITEELARSGFPVGNAVLEQGWMAPERLPSPFLRHALGDCDQVYRVVRLRQVRGQALALETSYFRGDAFPDLDTRTFEGSLHHLMTRDYRLSPDRVRNRIQAVETKSPAARAAAKALGTRAILQVERVLSRRRQAYYAVTFLVRTDLYPLEFTQIPPRAGATR